MPLLKFNPDELTLRLHRFIPDSEIPAPLKRRLVFGDREQIVALDALEDRIAMEISDKERIVKGELKSFEVEIEYAGTGYIKVMALNADDAKEKAREGSDMSGVDMEVESVLAREIKK